MMIFKDEIESLTNIPFGHTAFSILREPRPEPDSKKPPKKRGPKPGKTEQVILSMMTDEERKERYRSFFASKKEVAIANRGAVMSAHVAKQRAAGVDMLTIHGLTRAADERIREFKERAKSITAIKPVSSFNTHIATPDESRKTNSIKGKL